MIVKLIKTQSALDALEHGWNLLASGLPMRSWNWLATWWKYYGAAGRQLNVMAVYDPPAVGECCAGGASLIGIAPWYVEQTLLHGRVIHWLGDGEVCTDHLSLICRPKDGERVAAAVAEALTTEFEDWDRLDLTTVDADDAVISKFASELRHRKCAVAQQPADGCWVVNLPNSWDAYLAELSKSHRKQLRQSERRVLETGRARWRRVKSNDELREAWPILVDLHQRRRQSLGEPGCFASRPFHDFHSDLAARLLASGQLRLSWLELDGTPAAAEYHFGDNAATYAYQGGVDPDRLDEEPGRLSTILCLRAAIEEGHRGLDFLRGDEPYKAHWRAERRPALNYSITPKRRLARLRGRMSHAVSAAKQLARRTARAIGK